MTSYNFTLASRHIVTTWNNEFYKDVDVPEGLSGNKTWDRFENIEDPWNPENNMSGWVRRKSGDMYGCLKITEVNGRPAEQTIYGTPKLAYPHTDDGRWLLDEVIDCHAYIKYDGTNVLAYSYVDADGQCFTSFKLRTRPFMSPVFKGYWNILLDRYPAVKNLKLQPRQAIAFEMYGNMNPMMIHYDVDLELRVLYGRQDGKLVTMYDDPDFFSMLHDCPVAEFYEWDINANYLEEYERISLLLSENLKEISTDYYSGIEGYVLYCKFPDHLGNFGYDFTRMIKLKAPAIVVVHRAQKFVPKLEVELTSKNLWEHFDNPTVDNLVTLLEEEWTEAQIEKSMETITNVYNTVMSEREEQDGIVAYYYQFFSDGDFNDNKPKVMKQMGQRYQKSDMKRVYSVLQTRLGV